MKWASWRVVGFLVVSGVGGFLNNLTSQGLLVSIGALGYQVLTRAKMLVLISCGWLFLGDAMGAQKLVGIVITFVSIHFYFQEKQRSSATAEAASDTQ